MQAHIISKQPSRELKALITPQESVYFLSKTGTPQLLQDSDGKLVTSSFDSLSHLLKQFPDCTPVYEGDTIEITF